MTYEDFEKATQRDLKRKANECFAKYETAGGLDKPYLLLEAQFYMQELDRRADSRVALRDLILEIIVILLIGAEIWLGSQQDIVLSKLQASGTATASTLGALQSVTEAMNGAIQTQLGQLSDVSVNISYSAADKRLSILNTGKSDLRILGYQFDGRRGPKFKPGIALVHGESYGIGEDDEYRNLEVHADQNSAYIPFRVYLENRDGTEFIAEIKLSILRVDNEVRVGYSATFLSRVAGTFFK